MEGKRKDCPVTSLQKLSRWNRGIFQGEPTRGNPHGRGYPPGSSRVIHKYHPYRHRIHKLPLLLPHTALPHVMLFQPCNST